MEDEQELPAYPIRAYQLIPDPNQPTVVALAIETEQGHSLFLATRQILEDLGKDLLERAAKMPLKPDRIWFAHGRAVGRLRADAKRHHAGRLTIGLKCQCNAAV